MQQKVVAEQSNIAMDLVSMMCLLLRHEKGETLFKTKYGKCPDDRVENRIKSRKNVVHNKSNPKFHVTIENVRANVTKYQNKRTCATLTFGVCE